MGHLYLSSLSITNLLKVQQLRSMALRDNNRQFKSPTRFTVRGTIDAGPKAIIKERLIEEIYAHTLPLLQNVFMSLPSIEKVVSPTQSLPKAKKNPNSPLNKDVTHGDGAPISPHRTLSPNASSDVISIMMTNTTFLEE